MGMGFEGKKKGGGGGVDDGGVVRVEAIGSKGWLVCFLGDKRWGVFKFFLSLFFYCPSIFFLFLFFVWVLIWIWL